MPSVTNKGFHLIPEDADITMREFRLLIAGNNESNFVILERLLVEMDSEISALKKTQNELNKRLADLEQA